MSKEMMKRKGEPMTSASAKKTRTENSDDDVIITKFVESLQKPISEIHASREDAKCLFEQIDVMQRKILKQISTT